MFLLSFCCEQARIRWDRVGGRGLGEGLAAGVRSRRSRLELAGCSQGGWHRAYRESSLDSDWLFRQGCSSSSLEGGLGSRSERFGPVKLGSFCICGWSRRLEKGREQEITAWTVDKSEVRHCSNLQGKDLPLLATHLLPPSLSGQAITYLGPGWSQL